MDPEETCNNNYEKCQSWCGSNVPAEAKSWDNIPPGCIKKGH